LVPNLDARIPQGAGSEPDLSFNVQDIFAEKPKLIVNIDEKQGDKENLDELSFFY
jgi:hypothetical protein